MRHAFDVVTRDDLLMHVVEELTASILDDDLVNPNAWVDQVPLPVMTETKIQLIY